MTLSYTTVKAQKLHTRGHKLTFLLV